MRFVVIFMLISHTFSAFAQNYDIAVMGDSLAWGYGAGDLNNRPAGCLANHFATPAINYAIPGYTTEQAEQTLATVLSHKPKLVFISSGGNDALYNATGEQEYSEDKTMLEMDRIFTALTDSGAVVLYLSLDPGLNLSVRLPKITQLALSKKILVVDGMQGFWGHKNLLYDVFHPNDAGYKIMCDRIIAALAGNYPK